MSSPLRKSLFLLLIVQIVLVRPCKAYSVLTHEAIIDAVWDSTMKPLLLYRFPNATHDQLNEAHAFAYGGAMMPDIGYFPNGSKFFSNLVHYVRGGDFVTTLLEDARTLQEFAFALGALSHYNADKYGHSMGTNRAVPLVYPSTKKYGQVVTYEDDPIAHKRVEFGFDVLQTARGNYAPKAYHDFIGFSFADSLLRRSFLKVYGLQLDDVFGNYNKAVNTLRWCVRQLFPLITKEAWASRSGDIKTTQPTQTEKKFHYRMRNKKFNQEFSRKKDQPSLWVKLLSGFIYILPKVGPLKPLKFKVPNKEAEKIYIQSFDTTTYYLRKELVGLRKTPPKLSNFDFDTGKKTVPGEYILADQTYRCLVVNLQNDKFANLNADLKKNIESFYASGDINKTDGKAKYRERAKGAFQQLLLQKVVK